ncbi:MAG: Uma2 family endonuclease [Opitutaceae bacterium]|nr:Uma2 family endonuclease [Opitutaceae bacterium]
MESAATPLFLSVEDYLRHEAGGTVRHEYIGGRIHAMSGSSVRHNIIAVNILSLFRTHLRGSACQAYINDVKVRLAVNREDIFYYPDVMVACGPVHLEEHYLRDPALIVEVLSPSTESIDRREKLLNYTLIPTLNEYALVAQETREITMHRREEQWRPVVLTSAAAPVEFRSIKLTVPLAQIYEGVP